MEIESKNMKQIEGEIPVKFRYSLGLALEKFLTKIKNEGKLVGSVCNTCNETTVPPRIFCEECYHETDKYVDIKPVGKVYSLTVGYYDRNNKKLTKPEIWAVIKFEGIKGGLVHKLGELTPDKAEIGLEVKPVFKEPSERKGSISDILYFKPIEV
jgi:hypothetical protein